MKKIIKYKIIKTGLVIAVFLIIFTFTFSINRAYIKKNVDLVSVMVATEKIPAFSLISPKQVALAKRPRSVVPEDAMTDISMLLNNKKYYTNELGFGDGDIIQMERLSEGKSSIIGNLVSLQDENKMMVSINTNLVKSCANIVTAGTLVDVIVFIKGQSMNEADKIISPDDDPRLANLLVIDKKNSESSPLAEKGKEALPAVITLLLDKDKRDVAKTLIQYNEKGSIYLLPVGFEEDVFLAAQTE